MSKIPNHSTKPYSLVIVHPFDPWGGKVGGIESAVRSLIQYAPADFQLSLIGVTQDRRQHPLRRWSRLNFEGTELAFYPLFQIRDPNRRTRFPLFLRFSLMLGRERLSVPNAFIFYHRIEPIVWNRIRGGRNLLYIHSDPREWIAARSEVRWKYLPGLYQRMERQALEKAERVFAVTREAARYLQERYPQRREAIAFLPSSYREAIFYPSPSSETDSLRQELLRHWSLSPESRLLLFAGRLEEQKDPVLAVQTLAAVSRQEASVQLLIAGEGSLAIEMKQAAERQGVAAQLHFLGALDAVTLANVMKVSDALLLTSRFEGMPIAVLESLACGLPVVSTDTGEVRTIIQDRMTGRVVTDRAAQPLAEAVLDVLRHPERYDRTACVRAVEPYRTDRVIPDFYEQLRQL